MRIALAQIKSNTCSITENIEKHIEYISKAKKINADVILFPELSLHGHFGGRLITNFRHDLLNNNAINLIKNECENIVVIASAVELTNSGLAYNSTYVIENKKIIFKHRKINVPHYGNLDEGDYIAKSDRISTFYPNENKLSKSVILTCADSWNPALVYLAAIKGINLVFAPVSSAANAKANSDMDNPTGWDINTMHTAITYGVYVIKANRIGEENKLKFYGGSSITDPVGNIIKKAGSGEEMLTVDIDFNKILKAKLTLPTLRDAAPRLISRLINEYLNNEYINN